MSTVSHATTEGRLAFSRSEPISSCPYPTGSREKICWRGGWYLGNLEATPKDAEVRDYKEPKKSQAES